MVTSRPGAVRDPRWNDLFHDARLSIEPKGPSEIATFVGRCHAALRQIAPGRAHSEEEEHRLLHRILDRPGLRDLAQVPVLCTALGRLVRIRRGSLPDRSRTGSRNARPSSSTGSTPTRPAERRPNSWRRLRPGSTPTTASPSSRGSPRPRCGSGPRSSTANLANARSPRVCPGKTECREVPQLLDALLEPTAILWPAGENGVEFIPNALRGFLAARRFADDGAVQDPVRAEPESGEWDLPVLTAAKWTRGYPDKLIRAILAQARRSHPATARSLRIAALRCAETGGIAPDLRQELRALEQELLPPHDAPEAAWFAELGRRIVPHLGPRDGLDAIAAACVRCLALMVGEEESALPHRSNQSPDPGFCLHTGLVDAFENPVVLVFFRDRPSKPPPRALLSPVGRNSLRDRHLPRLFDFGPHTALDLSGSRITEARIACIHDVQRTARLPDLSIVC